MTCQTVAVLNMTWTSGDVIIPTLGTGGHIPGVLTSTFHLQIGQLRSEGSVDLIITFVSCGLGGPCILQLYMAGG